MRLRPVGLSLASLVMLALTAAPGVGQTADTLRGAAVPAEQSVAVAQAKMLSTADLTGQSSEALATLARHWVAAWAEDPADTGGRARLAGFSPAMHTWVFSGAAARPDLVQQVLTLLDGMNDPAARQAAISAVHTATIGEIAMIESAITDLRDELRRNAGNAAVLDERLQALADQTSRLTRTRAMADTLEVWARYPMEGAIR